MYPSKLYIKLYKKTAGVIVRHCRIPASLPTDPAHSTARQPTRSIYSYGRIFGTVDLELVSGQEDESVKR